MPVPAFAIYSDHSIHAHRRLRRWQAMGLFAAGMLCGLALSQSGGWPPSAYAQAATISADMPASAGCPESPTQRSTLRLVCSLEQR